MYYFSFREVSHKSLLPTLVCTQWLPFKVCGMDREKKSNQVVGKPDTQHSNQVRSASMNENNVLPVWISVPRQWIQ